MSKEYVDLEVTVVSEATFNVVSKDDMFSITKKAQELLNENQAGICFTIKEIDITSKSPRDFDSTIYADGKPRQ